MNEKNRLKVKTDNILKDVEDGAPSVLLFTLARLIETVYWSAPRRNLAASPNLLRCRVNPIKASHPTLAHMISSRNSHVSNSKTQVSIEVFFHLCNWL